MFLLGVLPLFLAYLFLGISIFWKYDKFKSPIDACDTLFSLMFGDIVLETFTDTFNEGSFGQLYLVSFLLLFYVAV